MDSENEMAPAVKAVIIRDDGKILLLKRAADETHLQDNWDVPGGRLDYTETPQEALHREAMEEAGVEIVPGEPVAAWSFMRDDGLQIVGTTHLCLYAGGDVSVGDEHSAYKWAEYGELDDYKIYPDLRKNMKRAFREWQDSGHGSKLVRDRIPAIIEQDGKTPVTTQLSDDAVRPYVVQKIGEEADEFCEDESLSELADLWSVMDRYLDLVDVSWDALAAKATEKAEERGGFEQNIVLHGVEEDAS